MAVPITDRFSEHLRLLPEPPQSGSLAEILHLHVRTKSFRCICNHKGNFRCPTFLDRRNIRTAAVLLDQKPHAEGRDLQLLLLDIARQLGCRKCQSSHPLTFEKTISVWNYRVHRYLSGDDMEEEIQEPRSLVKVAGPAFLTLALVAIALLEVFVNELVSFVNGIVSDVKKICAASKRRLISFRHSPTGRGTIALLPIVFTALLTFRINPSFPTTHQGANLLLWMESSILVAVLIYHILPSAPPPRPRQPPQAAPNTPKRGPLGLLRRSIDEDSCAICQMPLTTHNASRLQQSGFAGRPKLRCLVPKDPLTITWCKRGCGVNFHRACIWMWNDKCEADKRETRCPLCSEMWVDVDIGGELDHDVGKHGYWEKFNEWRRQWEMVVLEEEKPVGQNSKEGKRQLVIWNLGENGKNAGEDDTEDWVRRLIDMIDI